MREASSATAFAAASFALAFGLVCFAPQIFHDGDTWWHLATGDWILTHRAVPTRDIFTYTFADRAWNAHEWLSEVLMALSYRAAGWSGLHILFALAFGATAATLAFALRRRMDFVPALLVAILGMACVSGSLLARPHLLALPALALWLAVLTEARARNAAPPLWLAIVMLIWANLHGSFAFGLALAAALGGEAIFGSNDRGKAARQWGLFLIVSLAAALVTPQGLEGLLFPFKLLGMPGLATVGEWAPSDVGHLSPFLLSLLLMIFALAQGMVRLSVTRASADLRCASHLSGAFSHVRHVMLFGIAAPLLSLCAMSEAWPPTTERGSQTRFAAFPACRRAGGSAAFVAADPSCCAG